MNMPQENKQWFVIYTRSRAEKKVKEELIAKHIDCFLPMQKQLRQWKDRKKWVETPLISGYCFVHITRKDYDSVLQSPNVVCYITFEGRAAVIPEQQILFLKQLLKQYDFDVQVSHDNFIQGEKVEIVEGPLVGMRGELIDNRGKNKFLLRIEQLETSFLVEIPAVFLSALPKNSV